MKTIGLGLMALLVVSVAPAQADGRERHGALPSTPAVQLANANDASRRHPVSGAFQGARTVYAFESGALYQLYANPAYVSAILLEPGETLNSVAAGDTSRWMVTQAEGGADGAPRAIVLVKPQAPGLRTNIVLITDRRTYLVEAVSRAGPVYSAETAWSYAEPASRNLASSPVDSLNFNYRVRTVRGATPLWAPTRVFDDGRKTWIEFAPSVAATDLPPLFVVTADGAELVNYRVQGGRYMVDRVFDVGELRLGSHAQTIVRIERNPEGPPRQRPMHRGPH
ncbi:MAG: TrbG/VirB9 family P-type conjugative transfer protein [Vitreimonas sp.]